MSRDELIDLILAEHAQLEVSQKRLAEMKLEIEALRLKLEKNKKPPTNSSNTSQPPSRNQKPNRPKDKRKHRHGPPVGHVKYERKMVAAPDRIMVVKPEVCEHCQTDLTKVDGRVKDVNQITELPKAKAEVIEVRQVELVCPCCGKKQTSMC
jgi:transposase